VLLMAASRFWIGAHYPHDVLAGLPVGAAIGALLIHVAKRATVRYERGRAPQRAPVGAKSTPDTAGPLRGARRTRRPSPGSLWVVAIARPRPRRADCALTFAAAWKSPKGMTLVGSQIVGQRFSWSDT
jgi:hypothetical protein